MSIREVVQSRAITEVLHFTTNKGILGILDSKNLKSRQRLNTDARLEYIFQPNAEDRSRDANWLDYVNLSISRINRWFFSRSENWHKYADIWWCVLSFRPDLLEDDGIYFSTTNNIYTGVQRNTGVDGLRATFAPSIRRWNGNIVHREHGMPESYTTCEQAEVLYPGMVSTRHLQKIYVPTEEIGDELHGQFYVVGHEPVAIEVCESLFRQLDKVS
jgi:hypothetical protein